MMICRVRPGLGDALVFLRTHQFCDTDIETTATFNADRSAASTLSHQIQTRTRNDGTRKEEQEDRRQHQLTSGAGHVCAVCPKPLAIDHMLI